jgi:hypothetical protein
MEFFFTVLSATSYPVYSGLDFSSAWIEVLNRTLGELSTGITSTTGGTALGWIGKLAPLLILPAVAGLHYLYRHANTREEKWSFFLLVSGLLILMLGMAVKTWAEGASLILIFFGWLISSFSASVYCMFVLQDK